MPIAINRPGSPKPTLIQHLHMQKFLDTGQSAQIQPTEVFPMRQIIPFVFYCHEGSASQPSEFQDRDFTGSGFDFVDV
jgi:hypothetical protein